MADPEMLPLLPLRDSVLFPHIAMPIVVGRNLSKAAIHAAAMSEDKHIVTVLQREAQVEAPGPEGLHRVGTLAVLRRMQGGEGEQLTTVLQGLDRVAIEAVEREGEALRARVAVRPLGTVDADRIEALRREIERLLREGVALLEIERGEGIGQVLGAGAEPRQLLYMVASLVNLDPGEAQELLEMDDLASALAYVHARLARELQVLRVRREIAEHTAGELGREQREAILRRQLRAIQAELGDESPEQAELAQLRERLEQVELPEPVRKEAERELGRLERLPPAAAEHPMIRTYLEFLLSLPWTKTTSGPVDLAEARRILDTDHYGLQDVKERILEHLAVLQRNPSARAPILCLIGPPGVGKTSLGQSIARATGRAFERLSLGGMHDEAELRGHRRTYVGAMPGRILQGLRRAGSKDPLLMLDEVDKLGRDFRGDPAAALLEILDPAQNLTFRDNYLDLPFDLSRVLFITTGNTTDTVPRPLLDRMEVIRLAGYTLEEKLAIAERYLLPRQLSEAGLTPEQVRIEPSAIKAAIERYTREAGVRSLERLIGRLARRAALRLSTEPRPEGSGPVIVGPDSLADLLGPEPFSREEARELLPPGVAAGLAWTEAGGEVLYIEAALVPGRRGLTMTGHLGDVMQESARAAETCVLSRAPALGIDLDLERLRSHGTHVHVPAGAVPKDGPSAGVAMATALVSLYSGQAMRPDTAMTGEVTITGLVLPVGGIKEKLLAARRAGLKRVILPRGNEGSLRELDPGVLRDLEVIRAGQIEEVWQAAIPELLQAPPAPPRRRAGERAEGASASLSPAAPEALWLVDAAQVRGAEPPVDEQAEGPSQPAVAGRAGLQRNVSGPDGGVRAVEAPGQSFPAALTAGGKGGTAALATADALRSYLRRVESAPRLDREHEVEIGKRIERGERQVVEAALGTPLAEKLVPDLARRRAAGEVEVEEVDGVVTRLAALARRLERARDDPPRIAQVEEQAGMAADELRRAYAELQAGERLAAEAKADLIESHLRQVVWIARGFDNRGVPLLDLVQEGNLGLISAANKYDYRLGHRFATYARWWIQQAVARAVQDQGRTIRLPAHRSEALGKASRARRRLSHRLQREPTNEELAGELGSTAEDVERLLSWARSVISLQTPIGEEEDGTLLDIVANTDVELPSAAVMAAEVENAAHEQIATLTPREQELLALRFGIGDDREHSLAEIGERFRITRERARQLEARALSKLRHPSRANALKAFVEG